MHKVGRRRFAELAPASLALCPLYLWQGFVEGVEDAVDDVGFACEEFFGPACVEAVEGGLVEGGGFHEAASGELIDDEFDEPHLLRVEGAVFEKA